MINKILGAHCKCLMELKIIMEQVHISLKLL